ncbi:prolyl 4-hydroxylase alpha subunit [Apiospora arundinis]|uniref:Prolyl 4-hydroxylase alpha subunit n=1 Tax=Apiospora arundinis TaxID=335852 RepID=A0ABR2J6P9_9PEZI
MAKTMTQAILPAFALVEQNAAQLNSWNVVDLLVDHDVLQILSPGSEGVLAGFNGRVHEARPDSDYPFGSKKEPEAEPPRNPADSIEFVDIDSGLQCEDYPLDGYVLHQDPLVMYIPSFVKPSEAAHIIDISEPGFGPAYVENDGKVVQDAESRRSETSMPPRDQTVRCIEQRVRNIQTWQPRDKKKLETLSTQRYQVGGFFTLHYDYFAQPGQPDRASTLNVYLEANCTGGGTHFPLLPRPRDPAWCEYIECGTTEEAEGAEEPLDGVVFKPIPGNAIYWENLREDGTGYNETLHQGLSIKSGVKIGMNAWSWVFP